LDIQCRTSPEDLLALLDEDQLAQVLLNLGLNACDAMKGKGRIELEATLDENNTCCIFTVRDDGPGIDPKVRKTLFEPFVTTKGGGTGLGLPMVKRIVQTHGGTVTVEEPGRGCVFRLEIPLVRSRLESAPADAVAAVAPAPMQTA
jgi:signal transduction histidine kinase